MESATNLESTKGKLEQNSLPLTELPNDRNTSLRAAIRKDCGLPVPEVSALKNDSAGTTSKSAHIIIDF